MRKSTLLSRHPIRTTKSKEKLKTHLESHFAARRPAELPPELQNSDAYPHLADPQFNVNQLEKIQHTE